MGFKQEHHKTDYIIYWVTSSGKTRLSAIRRQIFPRRLESAFRKWKYSLDILQVEKEKQINTMHSYKYLSLLLPE